MRLIIATIVIALAAAPIVSAANIYIRFQPRLDVYPVTATTFEVIEGYGEGPRGIWCAAAHYAQFQLGVRRGRIYLARGSGPSQTVPGRKGVLFSTVPVEGAYSGASITVREPGANLLVNHAIQFCKDYDYEFNLP